MLDSGLMLSALKFICGETREVCYVCFNLCDEGIFFDSSVDLQKDFCNESLTIYDMFLELGVSWFSYCLDWIQLM